MHLVSLAFFRFLRRLFFIQVLSAAQVFLFAFDKLLLKYFSMNLQDGITELFYNCFIIYLRFIK